MSSQMVLTFDHGNTNPHIGIFEEQKLTRLLTLNDFLKMDPQTYQKAIMIKSSVGKKIDEEDLNISMIDIKHYWEKNKFLDMPVNYSKSLGDDRLCEGFYIYQKYKNLNTLLIDAGTFITADFISASGFNGGFIFPGITTFLKSFGQGAHLPVLTSDQVMTETSTRLPSSTPEAILKATSLYLSGILSELLALHKVDQIILTGGSSDLICEMLKEKTKISVQIMPELIHQSLFTIYQTIVERGLPL